MNDDTPDDLPTRLTRLLRTVEGVHTVYASRALVPTLVGAVIEAVRNDPVGMHLVQVEEGDDGVAVLASIGVTADESASVVVRRAHDALRDFLVQSGGGGADTITLSAGRVG